MEAKESTCKMNKLYISSFSQGFILFLNHFDYWLF